MAFCILVGASLPYNEALFPSSIALVKAPSASFGLSVLAFKALAFLRLFCKSFTNWGSILTLIFCEPFLLPIVIVLGNVSPSKTQP